MKKELRLVKTAKVLLIFNLAFNYSVISDNAYCQDLSKPKGKLFPLTKDHLINLGGRNKFYDSIETVKLNFTTKSVKVSIIAPKGHLHLTAVVAKTLKEFLKEINNYFGEIPQSKVKLELLYRDNFLKKFNLPSWTNAIFYRNKILIPLERKGKQDVADIKRSVKHEFYHSVIHTLTAGRCPGWIDEGLAQWAEGKESPLLKKSLLKWLKDNGDLIDFSELQTGFTQLTIDKVTPAYAQSLYGAKELVSSYGYDRLKSYFKRLKKGEPKEHAFKRVFGTSEKEFKAKLSAVLSNLD
jgi:Peptidase MA superfamily